MTTVIPIVIVALGDDDSYHLFINGEIDGKNCDLLIDTGASHTIFDANIISEISVNVNDVRKIESAGIQAGELNSSFGRIKEFKLGELRRKNWTVVLIDLTHVNNLYMKFTDKRVAGLIGSDFLLKHNAIIDYKRKELVLRNIRNREKRKFEK